MAARVTDAGVADDDAGADSKIVGHDGLAEGEEDEGEEAGEGNGEAEGKGGKEGPGEGPENGKEESARERCFGGMAVEERGGEPEWERKTEYKQIWEAGRQVEKDWEVLGLVLISDEYPYGGTEEGRGKWKQGKWSGGIIGEGDSAVLVGEREAFGVEEVGGETCD